MVLSEAKPMLSGRVETAWASPGLRQGQPILPSLKHPVAGLDPATHVFNPVFGRREAVDGRIKPGRGVGAVYVDSRSRRRRASPDPVLHQLSLP